MGSPRQRPDERADGDPDRVRPPLVAGRYELGERLGQGAFSITYQGRDAKLGRIVALKLLRPQFAADPQFVTRFEREARLAASVSNANIVDVYDYGPHEDTYFIAMQYVGGGDLKVLLDRQRRLVPDHAVALGRQILAGLTAIHGVGIIHRDIKPQNVLLGKAGEARLTDFGVAHASIEEGLTSHGTTVGTAAYMAPEQARGGTLSEATDLYAVGVLLFECLTGRLPFEASNPMAVMLAHIQRPVPNPREVAPDAAIPPAIEAVVLRAMAKDPADRYATATEMSAALASASGEAVPVLAGDTAVHLHAGGGRDDQGVTAVVAAARPDRTGEPIRPLPPLPPRSSRRRFAWLGPAVFVALTLFAVGAALAGTIGDRWGGSDDGGSAGTTIANLAGDATPTLTPAASKTPLGDISITLPTATVVPSPTATATKTATVIATATDEPLPTAPPTATATVAPTSTTLPTATTAPTATLERATETPDPPTATPTSTSPPPVPREPTETAAAVVSGNNSGSGSNGGSGSGVDDGPIGDRTVVNGGSGTVNGTGSLSFEANDWAGACGGISSRYGREVVSLYGSQTGCSSGTLSFTLDAIPSSSSVLTFEAFNGEIYPVSVALDINGQGMSLTDQGLSLPVWNGDWDTVEAFWSPVELRIPAEALRVGNNSVTVSNMTAGNTTAGAPYLLLGGATLAIGIASGDQLVGDLPSSGDLVLTISLSSMGLLGRGRLHQRSRIGRRTPPGDRMQDRTGDRAATCDRCGKSRQRSWPVVR